VGASSESGWDHLRILEKRVKNMHGKAREEVSASASSESDDGESVRESASERECVRVTGRLCDLRVRESGRENV
jgi:hypothetical protein